MMNFTTSFKDVDKTFVVFILMLLVLSLSVVPGITFAKSPYQSGYDHGCDDARISDSSDRYINQPEKGPSFHTSEFMNGYDAGFNSCQSSSNYESSNNGQYNSRSTQSNSQECVDDVNELGEFASNFLPGSKVITKYGAKIVC